MAIMNRRDFMIRTAGTVASGLASLASNLVAQQITITQDVTPGNVRPVFVNLREKAGAQRSTWHVMWVA